MYFIEVIAQKFYMQLLSFKNFSFIRCVVIFGSSYRNEMLKNCKSEMYMVWNVVCQRSLIAVNLVFFYD